MILEEPKYRTGKECEVYNNVIFEGTNMAAFGGDAIMGEFQNDIQSTQPEERDLKAELLAIARWYSMSPKQMEVINKIVDILDENKEQSTQLKTIWCKDCVKTGCFDRDDDPLYSCSGYSKGEEVENEQEIQSDGERLL